MIFNVGLVGVSRYSRSQPRSIACSTPSASVVSTNSTSTPTRGRYLVNSMLVPP
jgi:hypothetical protein